MTLIAKHLTMQKLTQSIFALLLSMGLSAPAIGSDQTEIKAGDGSSVDKPLDLGWSDLMPADYNPEALVEKFAKELQKLESLPDGSPEGIEIIQRIQIEVDNIPTNEELDEKWVQLPGFIAPLKTQNALINRFLLVPYFGACIHVPPPPVNQTVLVEMPPGKGIRLDQVDYPFLITGKMRLIKTSTDIGNAGYAINAISATIHKDSRWLEVE